jgi:hypothetical protein
MEHSSSVTKFDHDEVLSNLQSLGFSFHNESVGLRKFVEETPVVGTFHPVRLPGTLSWLSISIYLLFYIVSFHHPFSLATTFFPSFWCEIFNMKGRLRIRRLTMAKQSLSSGPLGGYPEDPELECFLDFERLHRMNECLVASTSKTGPVVHGVENFHGGRFWALANNSDSDSDVEQTNVLPKTW